MAIQVFRMLLFVALVFSLAVAVITGNSATPPLLFAILMALASGITYLAEMATYLRKLDGRDNARFEVQKRRLKE